MAWLGCGGWACFGPNNTKHTLPTHTSITVAFLLLAPKPVPEEAEDAAADPASDKAGTAVSKPGSTMMVAGSPRDLERGPASPMGQVVKSPVRRELPQRRAAAGRSP